MPRTPIHPGEILADELTELGPSALVSADPGRDPEHFEKLAELSGRPVLYNVFSLATRRRSFVAVPSRASTHAAIAGFAYTGRPSPSDTNMTFSFTDWHLFDECQAWCDATTPTPAERMQKLGDPARREPLRAHVPRVITDEFDKIFVTQVTREDLKHCEGVLPLEEAHWRLLTLPALCAGCRDRGTLREGAPADVVVYDYDNLTMGPMEIAPDFPGGEWRRVRKADGYRYILVNGELTLENGKETGKTSGHLLRRGAAM